MNSTRRFGIVTGCLIAVMAILAFVGVNFAAKPVAWMGTAFLIVLLLLTIGIAWALHPFFLRIQSIGMRYLTESISVLITVLVFAWLAYALFGNLWFLFGGSI